jgi:hypothetical protein
VKDSPPAVTAPNRYAGWPVRAATRHQQPGRNRPT